MLQSYKTRLFDAIDVRTGNVQYDMNKIMSNFTQAVTYYRYMYDGFNKCISEDGSIDGSKLSEFMAGDSWGSINSCTKSIRQNLDEIDKRLK